MKTLFSLLLGLVTGMTAGTLVGAWITCEYEKNGKTQLPLSVTPVTRKRAYTEGYEAARTEAIEKFLGRNIKITND